MGLIGDFFGLLMLASIPAVLIGYLIERYKSNRDWKRIMRGE